MPDGITATKEDMLVGQRDVKQFVTDMELYLECIVAEEQASRSQADSLEAEEEQLRDDLLNKKYNNIGTNKITATTSITPTFSPTNIAGEY